MEEVTSRMSTDIQRGMVLGNTGQLQDIGEELGAWKKEIVIQYEQLDSFKSGYLQLQHYKALSALLATDVLSVNHLNRPSAFSQKQRASVTAFRILSSCPEFRKNWVTHGPEG